MPLVLVPLVPILVGFFLYALLKSHAMTQVPQLNATASRKPSFLKTAAFLYKASGIKWVLHVTHVAQAITSRFALAHFPLLTLFISGHALRVNAQATEFAHLSSDTSIALGTLRHSTMPRAINAKVAPVKAVATHADHAAGRALGRVRAEEKARRRSISLTNKRLGGLASLLLGADLFIFGRTAHIHHRHHVRDIPRMRDHDIPQAKARSRAQGRTIAKHGSRIRALEKALAGVLSGALVLRILFKRAPFMRCTNWGRFARAVKCSHLGFLADLLAVGLVMFAFGDLCKLIGKLATIARPIIDELVTVLAVTGAALCGGEHTAAGPIALSTTALPQVDNPLTF